VIDPPLRQGRRQPTILHQGATTDDPEGTNPIVGMASSELVASLLVSVLSGDSPRPPLWRLRTGLRYDTTLYLAAGEQQRDVFAGVVFDPALAAQVIQQFNGS
jgi:hypothetical protein